MRVDDRMTGIIMRPVTIMDAPLAVHLLVQLGAWKWRQDVIKHQVDFGGIDEIDGAFEHAQIISIEAEHETTHDSNAASL